MVRSLLLKTLQNTSQSFTINDVIEKKKGNTNISSLKVTIFFEEEDWFNAHLILNSEIKYSAEVQYLPKLNSDSTYFWWFAIKRNLGLTSTTLIQLLPFLKMYPAQCTMRTASSAKLFQNFKIFQTPTLPPPSIWRITFHSINLMKLYLQLHQYILSLIRLDEQIATGLLT